MIEATASAYEGVMRRALELSTFGPARGVNPRVGCVILGHDGSTIAEGWHRGVGNPHAEVEALAQLAPGAAQGATVVVTLEPCNHTGHTGPCSEALINAGVSRVVFAVRDPGIQSRGGAGRLRDAGVEVVEGVLVDEVEPFLEDWLVPARLGRPFVSLKWASSLDGRTAAADGSSRWITGTTARQRVHKQRAASDAILVGTGTVLADDPSLTARGDGNELLADQPVPVIVGDRAIPRDAVVFRHPRTPIIESGHDLSRILRDLAARGIRRLYVEAGPTMASALVRDGLVDEYLIYLAPSLIGGPRLALGEVGVSTIGEQRRLEITGVERLGNDLLITARPRLSGPDSTSPDSSGPDSTGPGAARADKGA
jgi:diaminohydroxyphosphoribosylaminopyrimidine deaminase/5-amino-6-(5-phosphoribosylamino)uracil reductase